MSAKTSTQQGRRTPLSLTGSVTKGQSNKGGSNTAGNSGNNANGHSTANNNKQDNKLQQQKTDQQKTHNTDTKENPNNNKKVQQQSEKKQQPQQQQQNDNKKSVEKNQNGINNSKQQHQQPTENKPSQQQVKDSKQQNGNENKLKEENDKKEKAEKEQDKTEKVEIKAKEDNKSELDKQENNKKEEKKTKEVKDLKDSKKMDKNETASKVDESTQNELPEKSGDKILKDGKDGRDGQDANPKPVEEKTDGMDVVEEQQQLQQKSQPSTPKSNKANKSSSALNKTPTEKTPQKLALPTSIIKTTLVTKREITTAIDDGEMESLTVEGSPIKSTQPEEVTNLNITPSATSTPGKILLSKRHSAAPKSEVQLAMQSTYSPERPRGFSQISGRKSIRPITDYTPSKFQSNSQFRESYRRINTELDVTNTSINVTVGSEVPNNLSFSFFGRGRKREHTPQQLSQSAIGELRTDVEVSPPKKARLEGFFSVVSSPLTLLRNRFSKATLQSSTPVNLQQKLNAAEDEIEVQNVSGLSIHEDLSKTEKETEISTASNNESKFGEDSNENKSNSAIKEVLEDNDCHEVSLKSEISCDVEQTREPSDIKITETPLKLAVGDPLSKNKRCIVM